MSSDYNVAHPCVNIESLLGKKTNDAYTSERITSSMEASFSGDKAAIF